MNKVWIKFGLLVGLMMVLSGCFVELMKHEQEEAFLSGGKEWYVYKIILEDGRELIPKWENAKSTLSFNVDENRIFGVIACNNYFATFHLKRKKLSVSNTGWSRRICYPEDSMRYEYWFIKSLEGEFVVKKENKELILQSDRAVYYLR